MPKRVLLCSLDGVRPDALQLAETPHIDRLICEGASTMKAQTVMPSCTLPTHTSMLRGVDTARHGVNTNVFRPLVRPVPSLLEVAFQHGLSTGASYNWEQLRDLADPGHLHFSLFCQYPGFKTENTYQSELAQIDHLCKLLGPMNTQVLFFYLGSPDVKGHSHGWMSSEYIRAISHADRCLGIVLDKFAELGWAEETYTLVQSDHGGHDRTHGTDCPEDMTIPWIIHGPTIRKGYTIQGPVRICDTCVTLAHILGLPPSDQWDGRVIQEIFEAE